MTSEKGYKGIAFPFRFGGSGGVVTSSTGTHDLSHIEESIQQIIRTNVGERIFESKFGSKVPSMLFSVTDDETEMELLKFYVKEAIEEWESRVEVLNVGITSVEEENNDSKLVIDIDVRVIRYLTNQSIRVSLPLNEGGLI